MIPEIRTLFLLATVATAAPLASASTTSPHSANPSPTAQGEGHPGDLPGSRRAQPGSSARNRPSRRIREDELRCLALNIYHEARSQSDTGQAAVAAVTLNRVSSKSFPDSVCRVVRQGSQKRNRCQFSWWCDGRSDEPTERAAWHKALEISRASLLGTREDPTHGALYYHANHVRPRWSRKFRRTARIDDHIFYKPTKPSATLSSVQ